MPLRTWLSQDIAAVMRRQRYLTAIRNVAGFAIARMRDVQLQEVASSMTLTSLLSLVPLLAVSLAVFAAFPSFEGQRQQLEAAIFNSFLPPENRETIVEYLRQFASHASGLGVFGLAGLALTGLLMIDKFFVTVNQIFKVRRMRPWLQRALIYWAMLTLGPLTIALSISFSGLALHVAAGNADFQSLKELADLGKAAGSLEAASKGMPSWLASTLQLAIQTLGYALLFKYVPNCRVLFSHALIGGLTAASGGLLVKVGFSIYVTAGTLSSIYGAFVAVPVFLIWLYVAWLLVFLGAAVTATIPLLTSGRYADSYRMGNDFLTGVALLEVLTAARSAGSGVVTTKALAYAVDAYPQQVERIMVMLSQAGYCGEVHSDRSAKSTAWALICDPDEKSLRDCAALLLLDPDNTLVTPKRIGAKREEGLLFDWFRRWMNEPAIDAPLSALLADGGKEEALARLGKSPAAEDSSSRLPDDD